MHELAVTQSLLDIALRHAQQANAVRITQMTIVVGEMSAIVDDSVQFYWDMISDGTIAKGATLVFKRVPAVLCCEACGHEFPLDHTRFTCPICDSLQVILTGGQDFFLESIEVDLAADQPVPE